MLCPVDLYVACLQIQVVFDLNCGCIRTAIGVHCNKVSEECGCTPTAMDGVYCNKVNEECGCTPTAIGVHCNKVNEECGCTPTAIGLVYSPRWLSPATSSGCYRRSCSSASPSSLACCVRGG